MRIQDLVKPLGNEMNPLADSTTNPALSKVAGIAGAVNPVVGGVLGVGSWLYNESQKLEANKKKMNLENSNRGMISMYDELGRASRNMSEDMEARSTTFENFM